VRQPYWQRHQFGRFPAGVTEHHSLVASAADVDSSGYVGRLSLQHDLDARATGIEAEIGTRITDGGYGGPSYLLGVQSGAGGYLASEHGQVAGHQRLAGYAGGRVLLERGV
jgi:hypothetical protein